MIMLSIQTLTKLYDGIPVVDDVTLDIPRGKVTSLIGPNGAGKSPVLGIAATATFSLTENPSANGTRVPSPGTSPFSRNRTTFR